MLHLRASSLADTHAIAGKLAALARTGDMIVLAGEMGAGKTAFAQGFGSALGVVEPITSPTFTLVHSYELGRITLHHADIYRLGTRHEVADLALAELAENDGIVLLEWGDVVLDSLGDYLLVRLDHLPDDTANDTANDNSRALSLTGNGKGWASRWERLAASLATFAMPPVASRERP
ncbi:MAG: tRNA (adenosine(37)-N6)-threonylcarbamoyltransferase complex ATPase subunit type 1 TsaE [Actinobacteria bacterium]|nr:tRNA (adenosine(37)-N6)-threonylcarbamoyltransferase complex ATPase subunit type 1 TsaE [Actinomycetota bacterium]